jgi:hypothetical protein
MFYIENDIYVAYLSKFQKGKNPKFSQKKKYLLYSKRS